MSNRIKIPRRISVEFDTFHAFTWKQRLKILIGFNCIARVVMLFDRRDGSCHQQCAIKLTEFKSDKDLIEHQRMEDMKRAPEVVK